MSEEKKKEVESCFVGLFAYLMGVIVLGAIVYFIFAFVNEYEIKKNNLAFGQAVVRVIDEWNGILRMYKDDKERNAALKKIDVTKCPSDFRDAFYRCVEARVNYVTYCESDSFFHPINNDQLNEYKEQFNKCVDELSTITKKYAKFKEDETNQQ